MTVSESQKRAFALAAMSLAREVSRINKEINSLMEEYVAEDYGSLITDSVLDLTPLPELTSAEFVDGIGAMDAISTAIENNKTNLYKIAAP